MILIQNVLVLGDLNRLSSKSTGIKFRFPNLLRPTVILSGVPP